MQLEQLISLWPELLVNTVGVLLGGVGALALARWQLRRQSSEERERSREHVNAVLDWARLELDENLELIDELQRVFERDRAARSDLLRWAATIAEALRLEAHSELVRGGHHRRLPAAVESQFLRGYQATSALRNALRQAEPAVNFYIGCCGEEDSAQRLVAELEERIATGRGQVARSREIIDRLDLTGSRAALRAPGAVEPAT